MAVQIKKWRKCHQSKVFLFFVSWLWNPRLISWGVSLFVRVIWVYNFPLAPSAEEEGVLRQDPLEAILVIFGRRALIFLLESSWKKWKITPLLCACAVVITLETQKCRKRAPRSVEFNFFINGDRQKRFSQNERRKADLQNIASDFKIFA